MKSKRVREIAARHASVTKMSDFKEWNTIACDDRAELLEIIQDLESHHNRAMARLYNRMEKRIEAVREIAAGNAKDADDLEEDLRGAKSRIKELEGDCESAVDFPCDACPYPDACSDFGCWISKGRE